MRRSPVLHWLFTILTLGVYGLWWLCLLACEVTALEGGNVAAVHKRTRIFFSGVLVYCGLVGLGRFLITSEGTDSNVLVPVVVAACALAIALECFLLYLLVYVARALRRISGDSAPRSGLVLLLAMLWLIGLPYLQIYLNDQLSRNSRPA